MKTRWEKDSLYLDASKVHEYKIAEEDGRKMRSSIVLMGSLLGRLKRAEVPYPGGCVIGTRPIDLHIRAMEKMGARVVLKEDILEAETKGLLGAEIVFSKCSVGATQNAILGAVTARGETQLYGCAVEPEVVWLCRFLNACGAKIKGTGTKTLVITGVPKLEGAKFTVPPDRIVAGTYLCACAITKGEVKLHNAPVEEMQCVLDAFEKMGGQYEQSGVTLSLYGRWVDYPVKNLHTDVYPGFPTDLQSPFLAVLASIKGESMVTETIFENRFKTVFELQKMGADISVEGNRALIHGNSLNGCDVTAMELRGGAALVVAGLGAKGMTRIENRHFIERGYEDICRDLRMLGASIKKM